MLLNSSWNLSTCFSNSSSIFLSLSPPSVLSKVFLFSSRSKNVLFQSLPYPDFWSLPSEELIKLVSNFFRLSTLLLYPVKIDSFSISSNSNPSLSFSFLASSSACLAILSIEFWSLVVAILNCLNITSSLDLEISEVLSSASANLYKLSRYSLLASAYLEFARSLSSA